MIINEVLPLPHLPPLFFCSPSFGVTVKLAAPLLLILAENRSDWMNGIKFCSYLHWIKDKNVNKCIVAASNKCVSITYKYQAVTHSLWWAHMPPPPPVFSFPSWNTKKDFVHTLKIVSERTLMWTTTVFRCGEFEVTDPLVVDRQWANFTFQKSGSISDILE